MKYCPGGHTIGLEFEEGLRCLNFRQKPLVPNDRKVILKINFQLDVTSSFFGIFLGVIALSKHGVIEVLGFPVWAK